MRHLRLFAMVLFIGSLVFSFWTNHEYNKKQNKDMPTLTCDTQLLEISVKDGPEALMAGLTAHDKTDGDLTAHIMVASMSHFLEPGTVNVKYVVFDAHNNAATLTRQVHYTDYEPPQFSLSKAPVYLRGQNFDLLKYITATDSLDGDISSSVKLISGTVSNFAAGDYPLVFEVSNSCGQRSQVEIWVSYLEKSSGTVQITLTDHIVYAHQGTQFDPYSHILSVTGADGTDLEKQNITVEGNLDTGTPGCSPLIYTYADGTAEGQTRLTVVVTGQED